MRAGPLALVWGCVVVGPALALDLTPVGTFVWDGNGEGFGGFSDLAVRDAGATLVAASDRGGLYTARLTRDLESGAIEGAALLTIARPQDNFGRPVSGFRQDIEDMVLRGDGSLVLAFESYARITEFRPPDMTAHPTHEWDRFRDLWGNQGFEALAESPAGNLFVIVEAPRDGVYTTLVEAGGDWVDGMAIPGADGYAASSADTGPDGSLYLLERSHSVFSGFATRIRRFPRDRDPSDQGEILFESGADGSENFEGISLWVDHRGRTMISLISDNNFSIRTPTVIREFHLED